MCRWGHCWSCFRRCFEWGSGLAFLNRWVMSVLLINVFGWLNVFDIAYYFNLALLKRVSYLESPSAGEKDRI